MSETMLAEFQEAAVSLIVERLLDREGSRRFLLADEVGLGKTIVARGVLNELRKSRRKLTVIYLCSNTEIAEQNRKKLDPTAEKPLRRITQLAFRPTKSGVLRLYSFTPGTSLSEGTGVAWERRMLLYLCRRLLGVNIWSSRWREYFRCGAIGESWRTETMQRPLRKEFRGKLPSKLQSRIAAEWKALTLGDRPLLEVLHEDVKGFLKSDEERRKRRNRVVGCLRLAVQRVVLEHVKPDLVVLDEVQRFREVIDDIAARDSLAARLFNRKPAVLILSATPYRMLALDHEKEGHYKEFLDTVRFLADDEGEHTVAELTQSLTAYRKRLESGAFLTGNDSDLLRLKGAIESRLRQFMSRTERNWYVQESGKGVAECRPSGQSFATPSRHEMRDFVRLRRFLLDKVKTSQHVTEYWKSCPAPFTFMDAQYAPMAATRATGNRLPSGLVARRRGLTRLADRSLRFRETARTLFGEEQRGWPFLWVKPTYFYYRDDFFRDADPPKLLVFSGWRFVPKAISVLLSDECESRVMGERRFSSVPDQAPLRLTENLSWHVFDVCCPSPALAALGRFHSNGGGVTTRHLERATVAKLRTKVTRRSGSGRTPARDTVAQLDAAGGRELTQALKRSRSYSSREVTERFSEHVDEFARRASGSAVAMAPSRELHLARVALWSPANTLLRALWEVYPEALGTIPEGFIDFCFGPLRSYFNRPVVRGIVESEARKDGYASAVLSYCATAHFQAVADEYVFLLRSVEQCDSAPKAIEYLARVFGLPSGTPTINVTRPEKRGGERLVSRQEPVRAHFAISFGEETRQVEASGDSQSATQRKTAIRQAFNSPFWPFVLATTSVGQEGLDFHLYCRDIVHWNLPSNPVDLEQREGRINRRDGLAVRRAIARDWPLTRVHDVAADLTADTWSRVFKAIALKPGPQRYKHGLFPHWVYDCHEDDAGKPAAHVGLRRHLYFYSTSKDAHRYAQLKERLALYRLVFGQPDQEALLDRIHRALAETGESSESAREKVARYMINLSPMRDHHFREISADEARELFEDQASLAQLLEDVELIEGARGAELASVKADLQRLKTLVRGHLAGQEPKQARLVAAVQALAYLRNPCDVIFDRHVGYGLEDDCAEIKSAAAKIASL